MSIKHNEPLVSIIIPIKTVDNEYWDLLPNAVRSVLGQTYKNYELIISPYAEDVSEGRNKGIEQSKGEIVLCLDADDELEPDFLERTISWTEYFDIVATGGVFVADGSAVGNFYPMLDPTLEDFKEWNRILSCSLFKKKYWDMHKFDEKLGGYEDWDFWLHALKNGAKLKTFDEKLLKIRENPNSRNKFAIAKHNELKNRILKSL